MVLSPALRRVMPAFADQALEVIKTTTVASTAACGESRRAATPLSEREFGPVIEAYTAVGAFAILLLLPVGAAAQRLERKHARHG